MSTADSSDSRLSKNNCRADAQGDEPPESDSARLCSIDPDVPADELPGGTGPRPLSVEPDVQLRDEARGAVYGESGMIPLSQTGADLGDKAEIQARPWFRVVSEFRRWYQDYLDSHIEFASPDGDVVRADLENSYMPSYGDRYYARLMDLSRGVRRQWGDFTTVMLTFSASTLNADGEPRCPADHMREVADGWGTARKELYESYADVLGGRDWCYARVLEPTSSDGDGPPGYGHLHVAIFVRDGDDLEAEDFRPVMERYVSECDPAGWEAHDPSGDAVSIVDELEDATLGTYISEYIGSYGEHVLDRPIHEQMFYATTWATRTRRVDFSSEAQELIQGEQFRRETGLRPEDRGRTESRETAAVPSEEGGESGPGDSDGEAYSDSGEGWSLRGLCSVDRNGPEYHEATGGGVESGCIDGRPGADPPRDLGPPPVD